MLLKTKVMTDTDSKMQRQVEFLRQHTLTEADVRRMLAEKFERAKAYDLAFRKREALLEDR